VAELFTNEELAEIEQRAQQLAVEQEDASMRTALQVLGEAAANLRAKVPAETGERGE
jgi:hypothetical protein